MAFQLIYTSSARLLDSPLSGYGVVARSEQMPAALVRCLVDLSAYRQPAEQGITGPQCTYCVEECAGRIWHILTVIREAGVDHNNHNCHLAHHIILSDTEAHVYAEPTGAPPSTPAGIILALELKRFWVHRWKGEPTIIDDNTFPLPVECPTTEFQPTWHIFSGHPDNARILSREPYAQGCLALVPKGTQSRDVLRLLHEASALAPGYGWGMPFCTYGTEADEPAKHCMLVTTPESALHLHAEQLGFPTVNIRPGMQIEQAEPAAATASAESRLSGIPLAQEYRYTETTDPDVFPTPWRKTARRRRTSPARFLIGAVVGGVALGASAALLMMRGKDTTAPPLPPTPPQTHVPMIALHNNKMPTRPIRQAAPSAPEQPLPLPLPQASAAPADSSPQPESTLPEPAEPAPQPIITEPAPQPAEPAPQPGITEPAPQPAEQSSEEAVTITAQRLTCTLEGSPLPKIMQQMKPGQVRELTAGTYAIHTTTRNGVFANEPLKVRLNTTTARLLLTRIDKNEFTITPHPEATDTQGVPAVTLQVASVRQLLSKISVEGAESAAVRLPLLSENGVLDELMFVPQVTLRIKVKDKSETTKYNEQILKVTPADLKTDGKKLLLREKNRKDTAQMWHLNTTETIGIMLPDLGIPADLELNNAPQSTYSISGFLHMPYRYICNINQVFNPWEEIRTRFDIYVNQPCLGEPTDASAEYCLARVYDVLQKIAALRTKTGENARKRVYEYAMFYRHPTFASQLRDIFGGLKSPLNTLLTVTPEVADALKPQNAKILLSSLHTELMQTPHQKLMLEELHKLFSATVQRKYNDLRKDFQEANLGELYLRLTSVRLTEQQILICTFELIKP